MIVGAPGCSRFCRLSDFFGSSRKLIDLKLGSELYSIRQVFPICIHANGLKILVSVLSVRCIHSPQAVDSARQFGNMDINPRSGCLVSGFIRCIGNTDGGKRTQMISFAAFSLLANLQLLQVFIINLSFSSRK
jgi:hypothetical protein